MTDLEIFTQENLALHEELRSKIRSGSSTVEVMRFLIERLRLGPESWFTVFLHFRVAFDIEVEHAKKLGAWEFFNKGTWSEKAINDEITPTLLQCLTKTRRQL